MLSTRNSSGWLDFEAVIAGAKARAREPGREGVTMVIDTGLGVAQVADILRIAGSHIDHWKFGFGTSAVTPGYILKRKLDILRSQGILTYPGGTLFEALILRDDSKDYFHQARKLGFDAVEISDGTVPLDRMRRGSLIAEAREAGLIVITEVGSKDPQRQLPIASVVEQIHKDLDAGAEWVIVEGRECGAGIGIYDDHGSIRSDLFLRLVSDLGDCLDRVIWEAPRKAQQAELIRYCVPNVNLGNIETTQCLALEALRRGLRFETLRHVAAEKLSMRDLSAHKGSTGKDRKQAFDIPIVSGTANDVY